MNKLKLLVGALLIVAVVGVGYLTHLAKLRNDCEGLMVQEMYLHQIITALAPDRYDEIVTPVSMKRSQVCVAMYEKFSTFWPDKDPFQVGR